MEDLIAMLTGIFNGDEEALAQYKESPADLLEAATSEVATEDVNPLEILSQALAGSELDPAAQASVMEAYETATSGYDVPAEQGYAPQQLADVFAQSINATLEEGNYINVDNSLYADAGEPAHGDHYADGGEIKGGIHQANTTDIVDADHGAVVADHAYDSNFQTGADNTQLNDSWADNVVSGDNNTVASNGSVIGDGNVNAHSIDNSEFGDGDQDRSVDVDVKIDDSFSDDDYAKSDYTDDDVYKTNVEVDVEEHSQGYEPAHHVPEVDHGHEGSEALQDLASDLLD